LYATQRDLLPDIDLRRTVDRKVPVAKLKRLSQRTPRRQTLAADKTIRYLPVVITTFLKHDAPCRRERPEISLVSEALADVAGPRFSLEPWNERRLIHEAVHEQSLKLSTFAFPLEEVGGGDEFMEGVEVLVGAF